MFIDKEKKFDKKGNYLKKKTFPALPTVSFTRYFLNILTVGRIHKNKSTCSSASLSVYYYVKPLISLKNIHTFTYKGFDFSDGQNLLKSNEF